MLKLSQGFIKRLFSTPILKPNHHYSDLQLRQLLNEPNPLREHIKEQIQKMGYLTIPNYWKQALTDAEHGYYRKSNVFSKEGDFTTAPQISPLFGEMVATWLAVFMQTPTVNILDPYTNQAKKPFRIVELGPGRGMLMQDILRSFHAYKIDNQFELCFIQISEYNRKQQQKNVMDQFKNNKTYFGFDYAKATPQKQEFFCENEQKSLKLRWFSRLQDLIKDDYEARQKGQQIPLTIFIMNEFFDALPVTIIEYTAAGWRQKVLKLSENPDLPLTLQDSSQPVHQKLIPSNPNPQIGDRLQISPQSFITMDMMAKMIKITGGAILNIDYGGNGPFSDSIRAIKNHKYIPSPHYWQIPGACDLSAHVAFSPLAQFAEKIEGLKAFQIIPQQFFLQAMGIEMRVQTLLKHATKQKAERLESQLKRLTSPEQMGEFFQVQIISLKQYGQIYPHITYSPNVY